MNPAFFHESPAWPHWRWSADALTPCLQALHAAYFDLLAAQRESSPEAGYGLRVIVDEAHRTSLIEGERLDREEIRASLVRRQNLLPPLPRQDARIAGLLEMALDARKSGPITHARLKQWHTWLFSGLAPDSFQIGAYRTDHSGPMQIISHRLSEPRVVYEAPAAHRLEHDMDRLLDWLTRETEPDLFLRAGVAHLWFEAIHPFEDGNGRIGRSLVDWILSQHPAGGAVPLSLSFTLHAHQSAYYAALDQAVRGDGEISFWLDWFLSQIHEEVGRSRTELERRIRWQRTRFQLHEQGANERQINGLERMHLDWVGHMTTQKWGTINRCSAATAQRDLSELVNGGFLTPVGKGRSAGYVLSD